MRFLLVLAMLLVTTPCFSQTADTEWEAVRATRIVTAVRIEERIVLDGRLDEPAWALAVPATDFIQWQPDNFEPAQERTEIRFLYDDENLYIAATCIYTDPSAMVASELKEDFNFAQSDSVGFIIDTLHDQRSGFTFITNPEGAKRDSQMFNDNQTNADWDGVWDVKVQKTREGFIAEFVIPFKTVRFSGARSQEWGINIWRRVLRGYEESTWSPVPLRYRTNRVSLGGTLLGLSDLRPGRNLKVKPFALASSVRAAGRDRGEYDGGVDVKYSLTPSLTLDATYRTDFAQVEVDQQQVNLTRFNLFFPEKREFFLENSGIFSFGTGSSTSGTANLVPFFTRRIGLSADGRPIPIVGGGRISGKLGDYDVGFLTIHTERSDFAPATGYLVGRVRRDLFRNSWIGAIATSRDTANAGDYNRLWGADAHFLFYEKLEFDSFLLKSQTGGATTGKRQEAGKLSAAWRDDVFAISGEYNTVQPDFNPEVGFIRRRDMTQFSSDVSWLPLVENSRIVRNFVFGGSLDYFEGSNTGLIETRTQVWNAGIQFHDNSSVNVSVDRSFERLAAPFTIHTTYPRVVLPAGDYDFLAYTARFSTDASRRLSGSGNVTAGDFWNGARQSFTGSFSLRPNAHLNIDVDYNRNHVSLPQGTFTTSLSGVRLLYAFNARALVNAYVQYNADTDQVSSNIRFNLIHRPLSDLFVVYNDGRDTGSGALIERALTVKFTNLFNF